MDKCKKFAYSTHLLLNILTIINYIVGDDKTLRFMCDAWKVGRSNTANSSSNNEVCLLLVHS